MIEAEPRLDAFRVLFAAEATTADEPDVSELGDRAKRLALGVWQHRADLDGEISKVSKGWRLARMPAVDRNILRLALFELRHTDTPVGVVISEAVDLAKSHSTKRSGGFVNGVLSKLAEQGNAPAP